MPDNDLCAHALWSPEHEHCASAGDGEVQQTNPGGQQQPGEH